MTSRIQGNTEQDACTRTAESRALRVFQRPVSRAVGPEGQKGDEHMANHGGGGGGIGVALVIIFAGHWILGKVTDWGFGLRAVVVTVVGGFLLFLIEGSQKS